MLHDWFASHKIISYIIIYVLLMYIFNKVFRVRRLPLLKEILIYLLMGVGALILLIFQVDKLPIIPCLLVAVGLMLLVRIRYFVEARQKRKAEASASAGQSPSPGE